MPLHGCAFGAGQDGRAFFRGIQGVQDHQARIVDPAVGIDETAYEGFFKGPAGGMPAQVDTG